LSVVPVAPIRTQPLEPHFTLLPGDWVMSTAQRDDEELNSIIKALDDASCASHDEASAKYTMVNGLLYRRQDSTDSDTSASLLVVPSSLRPALIKAYHGDLLSGHFGMDKTLQRLSVKYWWARMRADVKDAVKSCEACQVYKQKSHRVTKPLGSLPIPQEPWDYVAADFIGPLPTTTQGSSCILVVVDLLTRWAVTVALPDQKAETFLRAFVKEVVLKYGVPRALLTDNGVCFRSYIAQDVYERLGIRKVYTSPYHPQTNGAVERFNGTVIRLLRAQMMKTTRDWDDFLPFVTFAYNTANHSFTEHSPFELMYGREPLYPIDRALQAEDATHPLDLESWADQLKNKLHQAYQEVQAGLDQRASGKERENSLLHNTTRFSLDDLVLVENPKAKKLGRQYLGPYIVIDVHDQDGQYAHTYRVQRVRKRGVPLARDFLTVNVGRMKRYIAPLDSPAVPDRNVQAQAATQAVDHALRDFLSYAHGTGAVDSPSAM
jgi:integrase-like protein